MSTYFDMILILFSTYIRHYKNYPPTLAVQLAFIRSAIQVSTSLSSQSTLQVPMGMRFGKLKFSVVLGEI